MLTPQTLTQHKGILRTNRHDEAEAKEKPRNQAWGDRRREGGNHGACSFYQWRESCWGKVLTTQSQQCNQIKEIDPD
ncbi:hypothetical protein MACH18_09840 [Phaeobacter italicus]|nr:hypothetical protein MACH18_09840 [Phaeobacter italicus]